MKSYLKRKDDGLWVCTNCLSQTYDPYLHLDEYGKTLIVGCKCGVSNEYDLTKKK